MKPGHETGNRGLTAQLQYGHPAEIQLKGNPTQVFNETHTFQDGHSICLFQTLKDTGIFT